MAYNKTYGVTETIFKTPTEATGGLFPLIWVGTIMAMFFMAFMQRGMGVARSLIGCSTVGWLTSVLLFILKIAEQELVLQTSAILVTALIYMVFGGN